MTLVVDASVVVDSLLGVLEPDDFALISYGDLAAPDLVDVDVASALRGLRSGHKIDDVRLHQAVDDLAQFEASRFSSSMLISRAIQLRENLSVYDATYVALAEALECELLTRDRRIAEARASAAQFR